MNGLLSQLAAMRVAAGSGAGGLGKQNDSGGDATAFLSGFLTAAELRGALDSARSDFPGDLRRAVVGILDPGAEPGGGGYIAQRIFSAKDERHGLLSVLWFNIAHMLCGRGRGF